MGTARETWVNGARAAGWIRAGSLLSAFLGLAALTSTGRTAALAVAESTVWSLLLAGVLLRLAGRSSAALDERLGGLLTVALGLSLLVVVSSVLPQTSVALPFAPQHLPVRASGVGDAPLTSTLRALTVGGLVPLSLRGAPAGRARQGALVLLGAMATLTAMDIGGLDPVAAPLAALNWLLAGWTCLVALEHLQAPRRLDGRWRGMLSSAVLLQLGLELVAVALQPSVAASVGAAARLVPLMLLSAGGAPVARRASLAWAVLLALDVSHGLVLPGRGWGLAEFGAVAAAGVALSAMTGPYRSRVADVADADAVAA